MHSSVREIDYYDLRLYLNPNLIQNALAALLDFILDTIIF